MVLTLDESQHSTCESPVWGSIFTEITGTMRSELWDAFRVNCDALSGGRPVKFHSEGLVIPSWVLDVGDPGGKASNGGRI